LAHIGSILAPYWLNSDLTRLPCSEEDSQNGLLWLKLALFWL
jgi:hypothetical protein